MFVRLKSEMADYDSTLVRWLAIIMGFLPVDRNLCGPQIIMRAYVTPRFGAHSSDLCDFIDAEFSSELVIAFSSYLVVLGPKGKRLQPSSAASLKAIHSLPRAVVVR